MNNYFRQYKKIYLSIAISWLLTGCEKNPFDYRTKYLGDYTYYVHETGGNGLVGLIDTSYTTNGSIAKGPGKGSIYFQLSEAAEKVELAVDKDGNLTGKYNGYFESSNTLNVVYSMYAPGGHFSQAVSGVKKR